jgi:CheY-like chemotaxis protein
MIKSNSSAGETGVQQRVLFVDHEVLIRIVVCEYLRQCGFRVIEAANTEEAIIVLSEPDLTVTSSS